MIRPVFIGQNGQFEHIRFTDETQVLRARTSIPGVYAAGDSSYFMPSQLIFAAADGSRTAMCVNMDLTEEDFAIRAHFR